VTPRGHPGLPVQGRQFEAVRRHHHFRLRAPFMRDARIYAALEHVEGLSVTIVSVDDWKQLVLASGEPTKLEVVPIALSGLMSASSRVAAAGSGILNSNPGVDIVRHDPNDAPAVFNVYHYRVIENLPLHQQFADVIRIAGIDVTDDLCTSLRENVYIVGPEKIEGLHHVKQIPGHIREAAQKIDSDSHPSAKGA